MHDTLPSQLSDTELVAEVGRLAGAERRTTASLIVHLAEMDVRRLHLRAGFPSLFIYCTQVLRLSEGGAYNRIVAARTARRFPAALERLSAGLLNLGTLRLIAPHLTPENQEELFELAKGKTKRAVEEALAATFPKPDVASAVRKLPAPRIKALESARAAAPGVQVELEACVRRAATAGSESTSGATRAMSVAAGGVDAPGEAEHLVMGAGTPCPPRSALLVPLSPDRYQFRFTASRATVAKFEQARDRLRHAVPTGDAAEIFDRALTALLKELDRTQFAATDRPHGGRGASPRGGEAGARTIAAAIKRAVWARDGGRCAFIAENGRRCGAAAFLEFHHVVPHARGGPATEPNIQLRCRAHNGYEADLDFGRRQLVPGRVATGRNAARASSADDGQRRAIGRLPP